MTDDTVDQFSVNIPLDGYSVEVTILAAHLKRELQRAEISADREYIEEGPSSLDLSRFVSVSATPTDEKWKELADAEWCK